MLIDEIQKKILMGKLTEYLTKLITNESDRVVVVAKLRELVKRVKIEKLAYSNNSLELRVTWEASDK